MSAINTLPGGQFRHGANGPGDADVPESDRFFDYMISFPWWSDMPDSLIDDMASRVKSAIADLRGESD